MAQAGTESVNIPPFVALVVDNDRIKIPMAIKREKLDVMTKALKSLQKSKATSRGATGDSVRVDEGYFHIKGQRRGTWDSKAWS